MDIMTGFLLTVGNKDYFLESKTAKRTDKVCAAFIERIGTDRNKSRDLIDRAKSDKATLDDFRRRISAATLSKRTTDNGYVYCSIAGNGFTCNFPTEEFCESVVVF